MSDGMAGEEAREILERVRKVLGLPEGEDGPVGADDTPVDLPAAPDPAETAGN